MKFEMRTEPLGQFSSTGESTTSRRSTVAPWKGKGPKRGGGGQGVDGLRREASTETSTVTGKGDSVFVHGV